METLAKKGFEPETYNGSSYNKKIGSGSRKATLSVYTENGLSDSGAKTLENIETNFSKISESAKNSIVKEMFDNGRVPWAYEDAISSGKMTESQARKQFKSDLDKDNNAYVYVADPERGLGEITFADGGSYYGHWVSIEADFKNKKYSGASLNG